jgi:hypothetical protein
MAQKWICEECGWEVQFASKANVFRHCPLCEYDIYDRHPPGKHSWMSPKRALQKLADGEELSEVFIPELPFEKLSFSTPVKLKNCVVKEINAPGAAFNSGFKAEDCIFLETVRLGAGQPRGSRENIAGATANREISFSRSKLFEGANLEGVSIDGQLYFAGVEINQGLELSGIEISGTANLGNSIFYGLVARNSKIEGVLILNNSVFNNHFHLNGMALEGILQGEGSEFRGETYVGESRFSGEVNFSKAKFYDEIVFDSTEFFEGFELDSVSAEGSVLFTDIEFNDWASMDWTKWGGGLTFENVAFKGDFSMQDARLNKTLAVKISTWLSDANFARTKFGEGILFEVATFTGKAGFRDTNFEGKSMLDRVTANDNVYFSRAIFGEAVQIKRANISGKILFPQAKFSKGMDVSRSEFENGVDLSNSTAGSNLSFSFCNIDGHFDLAGSETLGEINLADSSFKGTLSFFEAKSNSIDIRASQVKNRLSAELEKRWKVASKEWEQLKDSFQRQNRSIDADFASFKLRQLDNRAPVDGFEKLSKLFERVFIEWGTGYGTKPENVFFMSFVAIILFATAFSYVSLDVLEPANRSFSEYLKYSFAIFSTLGTTNVIVALEAFVGGFLMAMFTALLTRRIFRD